MIDDADLLALILEAFKAGYAAGSNDNKEDVMIEFAKTDLAQSTIDVVAAMNRIILDVVVASVGADDRSEEC